MQIEERLLHPLFLLAALALAVPCAASGAVSDLVFADVTPRAFSVIWASTEAVDAASVRVFEDAAGSTEITGSFSTAVLSEGVPKAHPTGIVKVDVAGLSPATCVYVQTETVSGSGILLLPSAPPFAKVCTTSTLRASKDTGAPIVNDLIVMEVFAPDGTTPADGALLLVRTPGVGPYPVSAFVGGGFALPLAVVNLSNLFETNSLQSAEITPGQVLEITEFRARFCPSLEDHKLIRFRVAPAHEEEASIGAPIPEIESPGGCFFADTVCDGEVNIVDVQRVLTRLTSTVGDCAFNSDLDIDAASPDGVIDIVDAQRVLNHFGELVPPEP